VLQRILELVPDLHVVVSDVDVVWLRDPAPIFSLHLAADLIFSMDETGTGNFSPDQNGQGELEKDGNMHVKQNTGMWLLRGNERTKRFMDEWASRYNTSNRHDQVRAFACVCVCVCWPPSILILIF
jgi:hypothetical protein